MKTGKKLLKLLCYLIIYCGVCVAISPLVRGAMTASSIENTTEKFYLQVEQNQEAEETTEPLYQDLYEDIQEYNQQLFESGQKALSDASAYEAPAFELWHYGIDSEVFGLISIPTLEVELPIYLGASEENMAKGAAVMGATSIPIGGSNTNAVIAGHRGWGGYPYLLDIEALQIGDTVYLTNLWEQLNYTVADIQIIDPNEVDAIHIKEGKDMITLLTCHPPNTGGLHRYLVFCERAQ